MVNLRELLRFGMETEMVIAVAKQGRRLLVVPLIAVLMMFLLFSPVQALTNDDCFKCHQEVNLTSGGLGGEMRSMFIDKKSFMNTLHGQKLACLDCHLKVDNKTHLRTGYRWLTCLTCHSRIKAYDPYQIREKLRRKGIKIPEKKMVGERYLQSVHGKALLAGKENAPNCYDCHTTHYPLAAKKPASTVNVAHLRQTCSRCHRERQRRGFFTSLAAFRVQAHRKGDLTYTFTRDACVDCHQGDAAHGEKHLNRAPCRRCHDRKLQPAGIMFGRFHLFPDYEQQYSIWLLRNIYGILFTILVLLLLSWGLYFGLRQLGRYYQNQKDKE